MSLPCFLAHKERSKSATIKVERKITKKKHSMISNIHHGTESLSYESASTPILSIILTVTKGKELKSAKDLVFWN